MVHCIIGIRLLTKMVFVRQAGGLRSKSDWTTLTNFIGGSTTQYGNRLKSCRQVNSPLGGDCTTSEHPRWNENNHYGTNDFGFSGLPAGYRNSNGKHDFMGKNGYWLTLSQDSQILFGVNH